MGNKIMSYCRHVVVSSLFVVDRINEKKFARGLYCHDVPNDHKNRFHRIIKEITGMGDFVDTNTFLDFISGKRSIDGRYFHLSFDDGLRSIYTNAFPVLKRLKIPAVFFVVTTKVRSNAEEVGDTASWLELSEMAEFGIDIGAHTRTHPKLSDISNDREKLESEIVGSKQDIEQALERECRYIAWPYGRPADVDKKALECIKRAKYRACFGAYRGSVHPEKTDRFTIPRHHFETHWPIHHIKYFAKGKFEQSHLEKT